MTPFGLAEGKVVGTKTNCSGSATPTNVRFSTDLEEDEVDFELSSSTFF